MLFSYTLHLHTLEIPSDNVIYIFFFQFMYITKKRRKITYYIYSDICHFYYSSFIYDASNSPDVIFLIPQMLALVFLLDQFSPCTGFPRGSDSKVSVCNAGDPGSILGLGRSPGEGNGNPFQYSCLENPMDRGAWWAVLHGVPKSRIRLRNFTSSHCTSLQFSRSVVSDSATP